MAAFRRHSSGGVTSRLCQALHRVLRSSSFSGNDYPVVSWLNDRPQPINPDTWSLRIFGEVENEITLTYADLTRLSEETATIDCTGGWFSKQRWEGVPLSRVLSQARPF